MHPKHFTNWIVENTLLVLFVAFLFLTRRRFPLSKLSYTLIVVFLSLHTIGAHYSYSEVPYNDWFRAIFGRPLHEGRNMFDRLVHFCFGLLLAYPIREMFLRIARVRGFWGYYLPLDVTMSFSMLYELIEWAYASIAGGAAGAAFLGTQGDEWDAQKDMAIASLGALISMSTVAFINWKFDQNFGAEFRDSLAIPDGDQPLGEHRLAELKHSS
jgi:putative membrane protein